MADLRDNYDRAQRKFETAEANLKKYDAFEICNHKTFLITVLRFRNRSDRSTVQMKTMLIK